MYDGYGVIVELDGRAAHAERRPEDRKRDNAAIAEGKCTPRYVWSEVRHEACATAVEVAVS